MKTARAPIGARCRLGLDLTRDPSDRRQPARGWKEAPMLPSQRAALLIIALGLSACSGGTGTSSLTPTPIPTARPPTAAPLPTATSTLVPTRSAPAVDATTLKGKVIFGYQGWFGCPGDGSQVNQWFNWFRDNSPDAPGLTVDFWPDTSELSARELCQTNMLLPDGSHASAFSAYNEST